MGAPVEVTRWDDVRFVLRSRDFETVQAKDNYSVGIELQERIIGDSVVMARGVQHFERRRIESILFRLSTLRAYETELVIPRLDRTLDRLRASKGNENPPSGDLVRISEDMLLELMASVVGLSVETPAQESRFRDLFQALDAGSRVKHMVDMDAAIEAGLANQRLLQREFIEPAWQKNAELMSAAEAGTVAQSDLPNNLIMLMLRNREHFSQWDAGVYLREATLYTVASVGTTTREICLAVDAIETWMDEHPEQAELRTDEAFLEAAFAESVRFHQSIPDVGRVAIDDVTLPSGAKIPAGQSVRVSLVHANRDLLGDGADVFNPFRPDPPQGDRYGLGFSDGRHTCIGKLLVLGDHSQNQPTRKGTAKTALSKLYAAGMRRHGTRPATLKATTTKRFESLPVVFTRV